MDTRVRKYDRLLSKHHMNFLQFGNQAGEGCHHLFDFVHCIVSSYR